MTITDPVLDEPRTSGAPGGAPGVALLDREDWREPSGGVPPGPPGEPGPDAQPGRWSLRRVTTHGWITVGIALVAAVLYLWNLSVNGYGNEYYAAAVKSASVDWKAFFFGSIDPGSFITVDKPPVALWLPALSARVFGFSSWSILWPQAAAGVASVLVLHRMVRRWAGDVAAHLSALAFALTPVAVLMFRFNNPDAVLTLLCLGAAWALWTALEQGRTRFLVLSGILVGFAFNTKMMQAFVVLPAFVLVYLVAGRPRFWRRIAQLLAALAAVIVSSGWWTAVVALWPAADRPYIGSTSDNSIISLVFGYNGFARIFGGSGGGSGPAGGGAGGAGGGGTGFGGTAGWLRMFNVANAGQISWLIPTAVAGLLAGLWLTRRNRRTDLARAGWLLWGAWAVVTYLVFSKAEGIFHPYYSIQLAPAVAALAGAGSVALWRIGREHRWMRWALPAAVVTTAAWSVAVLELTPDYLPWMRVVIVGAAVVASVGFWLGGRWRNKTLVAIAAAAAVLALLGGPAAYSITTVQTSAAGSLVAAGPSSGTDGGPGGATMAGIGGGGTGSTAQDGLIAYLQANQGGATYLVAAVGSQSSSSIIIATGEPVMTIGGFNGSDPAPTLDQFKALVASGEVRFILVGGSGGGPGGGQASTQSITQWAAATGTAVDASTYGGSSAGGNGAVLYDLQGAA